jgi:hypothetical protein
MKSITRYVFCVLALTVAAGCASTDIVGREEYRGGKIPRPAHIWVYDFAATPAEVPTESALSGEYSEHPTPQTPEQIATGRQLGETIATQLVQEIRDMGLPAERASDFTKPQINDLVFKGYLLSIDEGSAIKRVAIGFGSGGSHLMTAVEGFQMTAQGLRKLGSGTLDSGGSKGPGGALGAITFIATANPVGLIVGGGMKAYGEFSGSAKIEGRGKETAKEIAKMIKPKFQEQGWIN